MSLSLITELCFAVTRIFFSVYALSRCGNASAESFDHVSPRHPKFIPSTRDQALRFLPFEFCVLPSHTVALFYHTGFEFANIGRQIRRYTRFLHNCLLRSILHDSLSHEKRVACISAPTRPVTCLITLQNPSADLHELQPAP